MDRRQDMVLVIEHVMCIVLLTLKAEGFHGITLHCIIKLKYASAILNNL